MTVQGDGAGPDVLSRVGPFPFRLGPGARPGYTSSWRNSKIRGSGRNKIVASHFVGCA